MSSDAPIGGADPAAAVVEAAAPAPPARFQAPTSVKLRAPSLHTLSGADPATSTPAHAAPALDWMQGTWHVTHSTLPMWRGKANVRISYKPLAGSDAAAGMPDLDDLVEYQKVGDSKVSSVHGVSRAVPLPLGGGGGGATGDKGWAFSWRGRGWLIIAGSQWEVLGYGEDAAAGGLAWVVTYFSKTLFTPAGLDIYCRDTAGVSEPCLSEIRAALTGLGVESVSKLAGELFEVPRE